MPFSARISRIRSGSYSASRTALWNGDTCGGNAFPGPYSLTGSSTSKLQQSTAHWVCTTSTPANCLASTSRSVTMCVTPFSLRSYVICAP